MFDDFRDLLSAFNDANVRYLIVGGYAVSLHAHPRATKDLDILISADSENSRAVYSALTKFGAPLAGLSAKDFMDPGNFFRMGTPPVMVDIQVRPMRDHSHGRQLGDFGIRRSGRPGLRPEAQPTLADD